MKKNTPVIMGIVLILGIAAIGYFADLDQQNNHSTNYSFLNIIMFLITRHQIIPSKLQNLRINHPKIKLKTMIPI